ncbi:MAG: hypothetical protein QG622_2258 [Actinomycetota bacterium]|nr:hypothetical protein [Actinomycetota bacterium]
MCASPKPSAPSGKGKGAARPDATGDPLTRWSRDVRVLHVAHGLAAERYAAFARTTGVLVAVLTSAVGTALFVSAGSPIQDLVRTVAATLSLLATVIGVAQIALHHPDLAVRHRQAFIDYGRLHRRLDVMRSESAGSSPGSSSGALSSGAAQPGAESGLEEFREAWTAAEEAAPVVPARLRSAARRTIARADKRARAANAAAAS